jgi:hypothetical protein
LLAAVAPRERRHASQHDRQLTAQDAPLAEVTRPGLLLADVLSFLDPDVPRRGSAQE